MRNTLLISLVLALSACAQVAAPPELPLDRSPIPEAVKHPPGASAEGSFTSDLQRSLDDRQTELVRSLQSLQDAMENDLLGLLKKLNPSPPLSGPAKRSF